MDSVEWSPKSLLSTSAGEGSVIGPTTTDHRGSSIRLRRTCSTGCTKGAFLSRRGVRGELIAARGREASQRTVANEDSVPTTIPESEDYTFTLEGMHIYGTNTTYGMNVRSCLPPCEVDLADPDFAVRHLRVRSARSPLEPD